MLTLHDKIGSKEVMSIDSVLAFAIFPAPLLAQKKNSRFPIYKDNWHSRSRAFPIAGIFSTELTKAYLLLSHLCREDEDGRLIEIANRFQ